MVRFETLVAKLAMGSERHALRAVPPQDFRFRASVAPAARACRSAQRIVLKPTTQQNATIEIDTTTQFGEHIAKLGLSDRYSVPRPVAVIPDDEDRVIYVMERAQRRCPAFSSGPKVMGVAVKRRKCQTR